MPIVNFSVPKTLDRRVAKTMSEKGFSSKAEFFRFAAIHFIDVIDKPFATEDERFDYLSKEVEKEVTQRYRGKTRPSASVQLADV